MLFFYNHTILKYQTFLAVAEEKKVREKSRECHNRKPHPFPDPKRKRKPTNLNKHKPNKRTKSTKISSLFPKRGNRNTKRTEKKKKKKKKQGENDTRKNIQQTGVVIRYKSISLLPITFFCLFTFITAGDSVLWRP